MANPYYNISGSPSVGSQGSSAVMRAEFALIEAGFDLAPALTANSLIRTNSSGTGFSNVSALVTTWTPTLTCDIVGNLSVAYTTRVGNVVRLGRFVYATCHILTSTFTHTTASGGINVSGLPNPDQSISGLFAAARGGAHIGAFTAPANSTAFNSYVANSRIYILASRHGTGGNDNLQITNFTSGVQVEMRLSCAYITTSD